MSTADFRDPKTVMEPIVKASMELVYVRDPRLASMLDVSPPSIEPVPPSVLVPVIEGTKNVAFRAARKAYRMLKRIEPLQPVLQKARDRVRRVR